jgi:hypothetical protein
VVGAGPAIFLCSHVPMERFFDGMNQENSKTRGKVQIRKILKNKKERMQERKRRDFYTRGGSHTHVFSIGRESNRLSISKSKNRQ